MTGAKGGIDSVVAPWYDLITNRTISLSAADTLQIPQCFPDQNGQVYLRGQIDLFPVPRVGGAVLGILPRDVNGKCGCSPAVDVTVTSTAISYPRDRTQPDVCIVRIKVSSTAFVDVNLDGRVTEADVNLVYDSPYFSFNGSVPCPFNATLNRQVCGRADVNADGVITLEDTTAITQSAFLGTDVSCGVVSSTAFSCGSSRSSPLTAARGISLDSIVYFNEGGLNGTETPLISIQSMRRRGAIMLDRSFWSDVDQILAIRTRGLEVSLDRKLRGLANELESSWIKSSADAQHAETLFVALEENARNDARHDRMLGRRTDSGSYFKDIAFSAFAVSMCAFALVTAYRRSHQ